MNDFCLLPRLKYLRQLLQEKIEGLRNSYADMKSRYELMTRETSEANKLMDELQENLVMVCEFFLLLT